MEQVVLFVFRGDPMCFVHVLLNALELRRKQRGGMIVLEGESVAIPPMLEMPDHALHGLYVQAKDARLFSAVCKACSQKLGVLTAVEQAELPIVADMSGHVSMARYLEAGYKVITF